FVGMITILLAISGPTSNAIMLIMSIIGLLIVAVSLWAVINPTKEGYLVFSGFFLFAGVWNLTLMVMNRFQGFTPFWGGLGILQLRWALQYYNAYKRVAETPLQEPSEKSLNLSNGIWDALSKARFEKDSDVIEFEGRRARWRGWLLENRA